MVNLTDIHALSGFVRDPKGHIERLRKSGRPNVLTVNGEASVVVQDVAAYQKLLDDAEEARSLRIIRDGLQAINRGEPGVPAAQVFAEMRSIMNSEPQ